MRITHIGHACILIETNGLRILSDPWWRGPCFGAQWWIYPEPHLEPLNQGNLDYIYISHGHEDHLHPGTLKSLGFTPKILVAAGLDLAPHLRNLGFEVTTVNEHEQKQLGNGVSCRIVPTYGDDTFMTLTDGRETLANLNDAVHPLPRYLRKKFARRIHIYHPVLDYVFCGHGVASHFPNCYQIPGKDMERTAQKRQLFFNMNWAHVIHELAPRYGFPFAADVVLLEDDLYSTNQPVHNAERPPEVFRRLYPGDSAVVVDIAPGFVMDDGSIQSAALRQPLDSGALRAHYADKIKRAERYGRVEPGKLDQVKDLVKENLVKYRAYLGGFRGDYRALLRFRNSDSCLRISKLGSELTVEICPCPADPGEDYDITYTTRLPYLRRSLTLAHGNETLFVGSGGIFAYKDASRVRENLHEELMIIMSRGGPPGSRVKKDLKRLIKAAINRDDWDMYNLYRWTVWKDSPP
jgi:hypothetical protein